MTYPNTLEKKVGFDQIRAWTRAECVLLPGMRMVDEMSFSSEPTLVEHGLTTTAEMLQAITTGEAIPLDHLGDVETLLATLRLEGAGMSVDDLTLLRRFMTMSRELRSHFTRGSRQEEDGQPEYPRLAAIAEWLSPFTQELAAVDRIIDRHGNIKDNASPELADIRLRLRQIAGSVNSIMRRVMARAVSEGILDSDTSPAVRDGRLVIPLNPANKRRLPGIVHDESASGKTVFVEPAEVVEANNRVRELEMEERREINRILTALATELRPSLPEMADSYGNMGELDFIRAKARVAHATGGTLPSVSHAPELEWWHACHPVLQRSLQAKGGEIVPLDITLDAKARILVISGPNAGGKSVCLKTVGLLQYMLQCGMLPTVYENSHFGIFNDIFIDIGDDQSIEDDLSTYSSHLRSMKQFLVRGRATSLLLIDEFGGGTEPQIGGAIAQALLNRFNQAGMWGIVTTHYQNLKHFADDTEGLVNGSMLYDRQRMQPTFRLSIGHAGSSFALEIARNTGLPADLLNEARDIVGSDYVNIDKYLLDIARDRRYWENKRTAIHRREKEIEATLERYRQEAETLRRSRRDIIEEARTEARRIVDGSNAAIERAIHQIRQSQAEKEATMNARRQLRNEVAQMAREEKRESNKLLRKAPKGKSRQQAVKEDAPSVTENSIVKLDDTGQPGRVLEIQGRKAVVAFGQLRTTVDLARLRVTNAKLPDSGNAAASFISASTSESNRQRQLSFKQEIDVRGMRADEAVQAVTYFIDDAIRFSAQRVRILHGTGTGILRQVLRQYLATVAGVRHFADEDVRFGGAGITVVDLD